MSHRVGYAERKLKPGGLHCPVLYSIYLVGLINSSHGFLFLSPFLLLLHTLYRECRFDSGRDSAHALLYLACISVKQATAAPFRWLCLQITSLTSSLIRLS